MKPLTEQLIRTSFVNATRREAAQAALPDLSSVDWESLDYLGWRDRKIPLFGYVIVEVDGEPTGILLRAADASKSRARTSGVCAWCEDIVVTDDVTLYVAKRAGAPGRQGNTVGTLICTGFACSANVRRPPTSSEAGTDEAMRTLIVQRRIAGLRERSAMFARKVAATR